MIHINNFLINNFLKYIINMEGEKLYSFKSMCNELGMTCHNTKNRVIEKMCICDKKQVKELAKYLKCLMTIEKLCEYLCTCCCEMESITPSGLSELRTRCKTIMSCCKGLKKSLSSEEYEYVNCGKIESFCGKVNMGKSKTKSK
tara:strand:- start:606 stop:1037 length:432 start_codon:yes stop_codon:yes gene_type:complete